MAVVFRSPYYAWSQYVEAEEKAAVCSSVEFWRWFDDQLTREERDMLNYAPNGPAVKVAMNWLIQSRYSAWEKAKRGANDS